MTPLFWFLAGFVACLVVVACLVAVVVWMSQPESDARSEMDDGPDAPEQ